MILRKVITFLIWAGMALIWLACGPNHHLNRAKYHLKKAQFKGAVLRPDTVWLDTTIITEAVRVDTLVKVAHFRDTVTVERGKLKVVVKVDTVDRAIYINGECAPDTVKVEIPCVGNTEISTGPSFWQIVHYILLALIVGIIVGKIFLK